MRAMIVAAGLGTRLRPLTDWCPKPALPVRGVPLIAYQLALLADAGVREVIVNVHHLADQLEGAAREHCPAGLQVHFSREHTLLDTGGGIRRVAEFLRESETSFIIGGDMRVDVDLRALEARHRESGAAVTFLLHEDPREAQFGSVGVDYEGVVCRIGSRFEFPVNPNPEVRRGIYSWVNVVSAAALDTLPDEEVFSHLDGWLAPRLAAGARDVRGEFLRCRWDPVGTLDEYLAVQRVPLRLHYFDPDARARARGVRFDGHNVIGAGARIGPGASLDGIVVWDDEQVPAGFVARNGVFAGGSFHPGSAEGGATEPAAPAPRAKPREPESDAP